ncbi:hypothetical protein M8J76_013010 [Diaphorina citri]|nr:hypothetical protein M8J75_002561 [Diaphorina citri]KAI5750122.1 hypothetical protein M8J76_013010 [Diaphorina citri]KAI5755629.1 hypothetical protein M8J77_018493 [Diaphorina citri]
MDNQLAKYPASGTPLFMTQCGDDFNALQCELIATRRSNDALVLENNKLRIDLKEMAAKFTSSENRSGKTIHELRGTIEANQEEHEKELNTLRKQYAEKIEKIREYTLNLLHLTRHKYQTRISVLKSNMQVQQKNDLKARQEIEVIWQQRMDAYRNELTQKFNNLLDSVATIQENKRKNEEAFLADIQNHKNVIENLQLENRMLKEKLDALQVTLDQFKENNAHLREKLMKQEETVNRLQHTVKQGVEERASLETSLTDLRKKLKAGKVTKVGEKAKDVAKVGEKVKDAVKGDTTPKDGQRARSETKSMTSEKEVKAEKQVKKPAPAHVHAPLLKVWK